jgi:hypothetical protein
MGICPFFANVSGDDTETKTETVQCRQADCQIWDTNLNNCSIASLNEITFHIHQGHWHNQPHIVENITDIQGQPTSASTLPYAASITQEYACFQDSDGNGKVFGLDFKFIIDEFLPPAISGIQKSPDLKNKDIPEISWKALYDWKYNGGADPLADIPSRMP